MSIFDIISSSIVNGQLPEDFSLPKNNDELVFADGAKDGIYLYHMQPQEINDKDYETMVEAVIAASDHNYEQADRLFLELAQNNPAIAIIDDLQDYIAKNTEFLKAGNVYEYATNLIIDSENIESWDNLKFTKEYSGYTHFRDIYIEDTNISEYKLFKIDFSKQDYFFAIFKIFESCSYKEEIKSKETLHLYEQHGIYYFKTLLIFSTLNNLRTFEENEVKNFIYTKPSIFYTASYNWAFTYIVTPTNEDFKINSLSFYERFKLFKEAQPLKA